MAEANFEDFEEAPAAGVPRLQRVAHLAGAGTSLALVLGLAVWGYRLAVRDVNGIPVIKAESGPMRIAPVDPGGQISGNVGLSVNRVAAGTEDQPRTDQIVLAPKPVELAQGDLAPEALAAQKAAQVAAQAAAAPAAAASVAAAGPASTSGSIQTTAAVTQSAPPSPGEPAVLATSASSSAAPASVAAAAPATVSPVAPVADGALQTSPVPPPRPVLASVAPSGTRAASMGATSSMADEVAAAAAAAAFAVAKAAPVPATVNAAKLTAGTKLVQLGAYGDEPSAAQSWAELKRRFPDLMADKSRVIQKAESGGSAFYRLRAYGFKSEADTRRFCAALQGEGATCVPVILR